MLKILKNHSANTEQKNMAQQFDGWNLGLQPLNERIRMMARNRNNSMSFSTLHSASPSTSSSDSSSNLDTESTEFFHDNGITLESLLGVSSVLELYKRSLRRARTEVLKSKRRMKSKSSLWLLCLRSWSISPYAENNLPSSLGQFLALERRAANENRKNQMPLICSHDDDFALAQTIVEPNSLFVNNSTIASPRFISSRQSVGTQRESRALGQGNNWFGSLTKMFTCLCGQTTHG